jgi:signal transduction histidine kinase
LPLEKGSLQFTIESRILRELGERLVKQPEVALVELIKNAYDADARVCKVHYQKGKCITVSDDGHGMTLAEFKSGWMRIGTSSKAEERLSRNFRRAITGEKGIGRFAVRFLGSALHLRSVARDPGRGYTTILTANFNWPEFDRTTDLNLVRVPYVLDRAAPTEPLGVTLRIEKLRETAAIDFRAVRTSSISVVTPFQSLLTSDDLPRKRSRSRLDADTGFSLEIEPAPEGEDTDLAAAILQHAVLRAVLRLRDHRLSLVVYRRGSSIPLLRINDQYKSTVKTLYADIRFFPQRKGTFANLPVDGRTAKGWVRSHSGVAVFDRAFRIMPYGTQSDDWLGLAADTARRARDPRSTIARKHFPMDEPTRVSTQLNYMLRLPYPEQLIGIVQVASRRSGLDGRADEGLIPAADREGFIGNKAFRQLQDVVRGAVEAIASADRELQLRTERAATRARLRALRAEAKAAIKQIRADERIPLEARQRIIEHIAAAQKSVEEHEQRSREIESRLETMSLLGVVAGFMTHEFGVALDALQKSEETLRGLARKDSLFAPAQRTIAQNIAALREFARYVKGYVIGAQDRPHRPYEARPRLQQVRKIFEKYASQRGVNVEVEVDPRLEAPLVPVSLYSGVALNLYTNALKAVIAAPVGERRIVFRAWNEEAWHYLEVSDSGIGIPTAIRERIFDPLFSTTATSRDPLGSGMGLGLSLVKRGVESFGGRVEVVAPVNGFNTTVRVRLPLKE